MTKNLKLLMILSICIGLLGRIFVMVTVPAWGDEIFSIWAITRPVNEIVAGYTDPVHPPGYYLILKLISQISNHLFWLRTLSLLAFVVNCHLIYRLGKNIYNTHIASIWIILYTLSGYFLVFDWQIRMYTLCLTLILLSLFLLEQYERHPKLKILLLFTGINLLGQYLDYAFIWYFIPLILIASVKAIKTGKNLAIGYSLVASLCLFFALYPQFFSLAQKGVEGITWMKPYTSAQFLIPYFLGNIVAYPIIAILMGTMTIVAMLVARKQLKEIPLFLVFCSISSIILSLTVSYFFRPLFHLRSLQIIPLTLLMVSGVGYSLIPRKHIWTFIPIYSLNLIVFILSLLTILNNPSKALLQFYPWKKIIKENRLDQYSLITYYQNSHPYGPLFALGLEYSLSGKDKFPATNINHTELFTPTSNKNCSLLYENAISIYGCKNNSQTQY